MVVSFGQTMNIFANGHLVLRKILTLFRLGTKNSPIIRGATVPLGLPKGTDAQRSNMNHKCRAVSLAFSFSSFF